MLQRFQAVLVVCAAVALAGCRTTPEAHVKRAERFAAEKNYTSAILEYRAALQQDGRNGPTRLALADVYSQVGDGQNAYREYTRAADLMPDNVDAQLKTGAILLMANRFAEAKVRAERALAVAPRNAQALMLLGNSLAGLHDVTGALNTLNEAVTQDPGSSAAYASIGVLQLARGDQQRAEASFKRAISASPKSVLARVALAQFYRSQQREADAEAILKEAIAIDPRDTQVNATLAELYMRTGRTAQAEPLIKTIADVLQTADSQFMLAEYYVRAKRRQEAVTILERLATTTETYATAKVHLAELAYTDGRATDAMNTVNQILLREPKNRGALLLKGRLLLLAKKYDDALGYLQSAASADPPRAVEPTMLAAGVYLSRGRVEDAVDAYKQVLTLAPQMRSAQLALSKLYAATGQRQAAIDLAQSVVAQEPNNPDARLTLAQGLAAAGDAEGAERELRYLQQHFPPSAPVQIQAASLMASRNNPAAARVALEKAIVLDHGSPNALEGLVALDLARKDEATARTRVEQRLQEAPRDGNALFIAGKLYAVLGDNDRAEDSLRKSLEYAPSNLRAFSMLGQLYGKQGRLGDARHEFEQWAEREPRSAIPHTVVGLLLERENNAAAARKRYEKALELDPHAAVAGNNLAWMYVESGEKLDQALELANMAATQAPQIGDFSDTLAWVYYKKDLPAQALPYATKAVALDRQNALFQFHLGMIYAKQGEDSMAIEALKHALTLNTHFDGAEEAKKTLNELQIQ